MDTTAAVATHFVSEKLDIGQADDLKAPTAVRPDRSDGAINAHEVASHDKGPVWACETEPRRPFGEPDRCVGSCDRNPSASVRPRMVVAGFTTAWLLVPPSAPPWSPRCSTPIRKRSLSVCAEPHDISVHVGIDVGSGVIDAGCRITDDDPVACGCLLRDSMSWRPAQSDRGASNR